MSRVTQTADIFIETKFGGALRAGDGGETVRRALLNTIKVWRLSAVYGGTQILQWGVRIESLPWQPAGKCAYAGSKCGRLYYAPVK